MSARLSRAQVVGGLGLSFDASWRLTLVTLAIIPMIVAPIAVTASYVAKVAEVALTVEYLADSLEAARKSGIFLDDVVIGKMRSDWEPGPGYDYVKARTYSPSSN